MIKIDISKIQNFIPRNGIEALEQELKDALLALENGSGAGNDFIGWLNLASNTGASLIDSIEDTARILRENCEVVIVAGIGGSYLGSRAVIEALSNSFSMLESDNRNPRILFAGHNISEDYLFELMEFLKGKKFGIINISKSGTTTETALAFRLLKKQCEDQLGRDEARKVIVAITDAERGAARVCADREGYRSYIIPDNVGGRFSVLTPVGLLPIAVAGFDIRQLLKGAADMEGMTTSGIPLADNPAVQYAAARNALYRFGKKIEILDNFQPKLHFLSEWWKQRYGE